MDFLKTLSVSKFIYNVLTPNTYSSPYSIKKKNFYDETANDLHKGHGVNVELMVSKCTQM